MRCRTVDDIAREALRIIDEESSVYPEPRAEFFFRGESKNHKSDYDDEPLGTAFQSLLDRMGFELYQEALRENRSSHYMVAVDRQLKNEWDAPTVGLVLCRDGNRTVVEYALSVTDKPMGVAKYRLTQKTPKELSSMKRVVARLGTVVDATIADAERQSAKRKDGGK